MTNYLDAKKQRRARLATMPHEAPRFRCRSQRTRQSAFLYPSRFFAGPLPEDGHRALAALSFRNEGSHRLQWESPYPPELVEVAMSESQSSQCARVWGFSERVCPLFTPGEISCWTAGPQPPSH